MLLKTLYVKNFRNIKEVTLECEPLTVLVGENNVGKSNLLIALYKILKMDESPYRIRFSEDDFFLDESTGIRSDQIVIELTFHQLSESDRDKFVSKGIDILHNELIIRLQAVWEQENSDAKVTLNYIRKDDPDNELGSSVKLDEKNSIPFFYIGAYRDINRETQHSAGDLRQIFKDYNKYYLKPLNSQIITCSNHINEYLHEYGEKEESKLVTTLQEILLILSKQLIDSLPSQRDILDRKIQQDKAKNNDALKKILQMVDNLLAKNSIEEKISELHLLMNGLEGVGNIKDLLQKNLGLFVPEGQLNFELGQIDESDLFSETNIDFGKISILKQGSGLQSSFVIALKLSKLLSHLTFSEEKITNLIIALEEPEAHMHPHLQRSLIKKIKIKQRELAEIGLNVQFIVTTHSPFILSQLEKTEICLLKKNPDISVTKLSPQFFSEVSKEISERKLKHFDYIFRVYPEVFLSRGVLIIEGKTEFGAIPEFAKKMKDFDLDNLGLTIICAESKDAIKPLYLTLKKFTKCAAIRDNEGTNSDEDLIKNLSEPYFKTNLKNFEKELIKSIGEKNIIRIIIEIAPYDVRESYLSFLRKEKSELRKMSIEEILEKWDSFDFSSVKFDSDLIESTLTKHCKTALAGSLIAERITLNEIPKCYSKFLLVGKKMVTD